MKPEQTLLTDPRLRVTKIDEFQLLTCLKHGVWGSKKSIFKNWMVGDHLVFIVDKALAGIAKISGPPFQSKQPIWEDDVYPFRIPVEFVHFVPPAARPPVLGEVREALIEALGNHYGIGIRDQTVFTGHSAEIILAAIRTQACALSDFREHLDAHLQEAKIEREIAQRTKHKPTEKSRLSTTVPPPVPVTAATHPPDIAPVTPAVADRTPADSERDEARHSYYQSLLIQLGKIVGCAVWIAANDKGKQFKGKPLGDGCLASLPNMGLNDEATERIRLIDVIWIQKNAPVCAFEIETTTQVFSGLLRMSDLLTVVPALNVKLFIVAPNERQGKVMRELGRPTFQRIGLSDYCRFLPGEQLEMLLTKVQDLAGSVRVTVLDKIAMEWDGDLT